MRGPRWLHARLPLSMGMAVRGAYVLVCVALVSAAVVFALRDAVPRSSNGVFADPIPPAPRTTVDTRKVQAGETTAAILSRMGLPASAVIASAGPVYDLSRIAVGHELTVTRDRLLPEWLELSYAIDEDTFLKVARDGSRWKATLEKVDYTTSEEIRRLVITSSLWNVALAQGLRPKDVIRLAELFQWQVDFNTELVDGAVLVLVADGLYKDGTFVKIGAIHGALLDNGGERHAAIRHVHPDGKDDYYDLTGLASRKPFLRSPLPFMNITSGFTRSRYHPVLHQYRAHWGTDLGAPTGTPVRSIGRGTVVAAGYSGGYGNLIRVRHDNGYESGYGHLSAILVRRGQAVDQGKIIGKVGSTGLSTGPHLHYELLYKGSYVDPMSTKLPASDPIPAAEKAAFQAEKDLVYPKLQTALAG